jgi:hypothetical protein
MIYNIKIEMRVDMADNPEMTDTASNLLKNYPRASISDRRCVCEFYQAAKMAPTPFETASLKKEEGRA